MLCDGVGSTLRLRLTTHPSWEWISARASGLGGCDPWYGETVQFYTALYSCIQWLHIILWMYSLNPTINCRRFSLFTHTAGRSNLTGDGRLGKLLRRNKRELFLTFLATANCFSLPLLRGPGLLRLESHLKGAEWTLCPRPAVYNNAIIPHRSAFSDTRLEIDPCCHQYIHPHSKKSAELSCVC